MKKLIVTAFVIVAGIVANAAVINWDVEFTYKMDTAEGAEGWIAYYFDNATVSREAMITALGANDFASQLADGNIAEELGDEDGYFYGSTANIYGNPQTVSGYFVLFNNASAADATYAFVSDIEDATTGATAGQTGDVYFGDVVATQDSANWISLGGEPVPEPTSGLLLLLGMAGLALKRKQA